MPNSNEAGADPAFPSNVVIGIAGNPVSSGNPLPVSGTVSITGAVTTNTPTATAPGTTATTASPIQGVTGGVPVTSTIQIAGSLVSASNALPVVATASGIGVDTVFPTGVSTSGTSLGTLPSGGRGVIVHLPPGASISVYVAASVAASAAAAVTVSQTYANPSSSTSSIDLQFNLFGSNQVWIANIALGTATAYTSGLPIYRFV